MRLPSSKKQSAGNILRRKNTPDLKNSRHGTPEGRFPEKRPAGCPKKPDQYRAAILQV
jgi:hypothetical protein